MKSYPWSGKRCWLVGASSGIGAACAMELSLQGAKVAITARNGAALEQMVQEHPDAGYFPVVADVCSQTGLQLAYAKIREAWGGIDLLLYLAGNYKAARAWELESGGAQEIMDVNYLGAVRSVECVLTDFLERKSGHIALTSSIAGLRGLPKSLYYGPSKAALTHFAEILRLDLAPRGITVQVIHPGFVATPLTAQNDFAMPHLLQPSQAAKLLVQGLQKDHFEIHFPKIFTQRFHWLRCLPYSWYFPLIRKATKV
ncbi:MAG: SDR family NAD(P)-dependent oxidoreductase [Acidithiobacillus sp.]|nr:SDR family NAD(P)-dependent oxidoreductase [Acidithiobacillus sp.]